MNPERWQKVKALFDAVVELTPDEREPVVSNACGADDDLRRDVERLLDSFENAQSFMEQPAVKEVAGLIIEPEGKLQTGASLGHYEIIKQIGAGGMGEVYLAQDTRLERLVAVKILSEKLEQHELNLQRFTREAKAASALNHPNILVIHEIGKEGKSNYIVSEFIEGKTLREYLNESPLKLSEVLDISVQMLNALSTAHAANIIHRDIKPENIMVRPDGYVKILDFGLAKLVEQKAAGFGDAALKHNQTARGVILGTVSYMSPEQAKGERVDERTDIFSFGVVLYEMIAARTPFAGASVSETFANLITQEPPPLARFAAHVPTELERIVAKTLKKNQDERYQTMKDLLADLKSLHKRLSFADDFNQLRVTTAGSESPVETKTHKIEMAARAEEMPFANFTFNQKSIAVLPFANISGNAENEYFCDGLAEELLNALAKINNLKVAARTSSFSFKNRNVNASEIGSALNVETILAGSVRRSGNRLRISVQLVNAANGYHLWSERYDGELKDIFDLQDKITLAVIDELKVKFLSEEKAALRHRYGDNIEAYQLYLKGRHHYLKLRPAEIQTGISCFEQAIALDPNYALAYVGLAQAYQTLPLAAELPATEFFPKAKAAANKALEIDDELAEAHGVLGWLLFWYDWDWEASATECRRALELNPKSADAHEAYAHLLSNTGRHADALAEIRRAVELDPLNLRINTFAGLFLLHAGQIDEGLAKLQQTFELEPNFWLAHLFAASAYVEKGMYPEARAAANQAKELSGGSSHAAALEIYALAKAGKQAEAKASLAELLQSSKTRHVPPYHLALAYQGLDERDETYIWLNRAFEERDPKLTFLKVEPKWNNLRSDSRFQELLRLVGFSTGETLNKTSQPENEILKTKTTAANAFLDEQTLAIAATAITDSTPRFKTAEVLVPGIPNNQKRIFVVGIIIFLLVAVGLGYYFRPAMKTSFSASGKKSLAVLPFVNANQDRETEYLSDGITESIINNLSQLSSLKVMSRNSAFRFKNNQTDTRAIAAQLGVETLVTGDIKQIGDRLVINVRLIDPSDDSQIWGNQYVKNSGDVLAAQNEIAQAVANNLRLKLTNAEQQRLAKNYTNNPEAYELYLRGRFHQFKITEPEFRKAIAYYERAIALDPNYALAYAAIANVYRVLAITTFAPSKEVIPKSKEAALRALELDDSLADAYAALGWTGFLYDWNWKEAEKNLQKAVELNPNNADVRLAYAHLMSNLGRHDEAVAQSRRMREIDPLTLIANALDGQFLFYAGRYPEAIDRLQKTLELDPNFWVAHNALGRVYINQRRWNEALAELTTARELSGGSTEPVTQLGYALAKSGNREKAQATLEELKTFSNNNFVPAYNFAMIYNGLGEKEKALDYLEKSFEEREVQLTFIKIDTRWDELRDEPRFVEIMKKMNFK